MLIDAQEPASDRDAMSGLRADARAATLALVRDVGEEDLVRVHSPIMSPLVWDLGHIAAYEDLWLCHRHGGLDLLRPDLARAYDAFETPRHARGEAELLGPAETFEYLERVRERATDVLARGDGGEEVCEMVLRHELQHCETMRQTMALAGLLSPSDRRRMGQPLPSEKPDEWVELAAGEYRIGAPDGGFAYDNERSRHTVTLAAFEIARQPATNAAWRAFCAEGGYERSEWWSDEGWRWREQHEIACPGAIAHGDPRAPVCNVSWFEADAFARSQGARLPSEAEWEGAASSGALESTGAVWEWTGSLFDGYPGFLAHPYREYSEVFFGRNYRVLRGGSWATSQRVATHTFRNWDLPLRRQIFAGVRLVRDRA